MSLTSHMMTYARVANENPDWANLNKMQRHLTERKHRQYQPTFESNPNRLWTRRIFTFHHSTIPGASTVAYDG